MVFEWCKVGHAEDPSRFPDNPTGIVIPRPAPFELRWPRDLSWISNQQLRRVERDVTSRKQRIATMSTRHFSQRDVLLSTNPASGLRVQLPGPFQTCYNIEKGTQ